MSSLRYFRNRGGLARYGTSGGRLEVPKTPVERIVAEAKRLRLKAEREEREKRASR